MIVSVLISKATGKIKKKNVLLSLQVCYMRSNEMLESKRIVDVWNAMADKSKERVYAVRFLQATSDSGQEASISGN